MNRLKRCRELKFSFNLLHRFKKYVISLCIKSARNHWLGTFEKVCLDSQGCACHYQMYLRMMFRYRRRK